MSTPSASQAVGWLVSNPASRSAAGQSSRRSMPTARYSVVGVAPILDSVEVLNSITSGWSISYSVVPAGQDSR